MLAWLVGYFLVLAFLVVVPGGLTYALARRRGVRLPLWWGVFGGLLPLLTLLVLLVSARGTAADSGEPPASRPLAWAGVVVLVVALLLPIFSQVMAFLAEGWAEQGRALTGAATVAIRCATVTTAYAPFLHALLVGSAAGLIFWRKTPGTT